MAQALLRRKGGCAVFGHESVYGGTATVHTYCKNCGQTTSSAHTYKKTTEWTTDHSECTVTWTCDCGYTCSSTYDREGYRTNPDKVGDCVTPSEYECYCYDSDGVRQACSSWHTGSVNSSIHKGPEETTSSGGNCVTAGSSTTVCTACGSTIRTTTGSVVPSIHKGPFTETSQASTCVTPGWIKTTCQACRNVSSQTDLGLDSSNHEQEPVYGGTEDCHRYYPCCNTDTGESHTYTYTEKSWYPSDCSSGDHTYFTYTSSCACGYSYDTKNYDIYTQTSVEATCTEQRKYDFHGTTPDGESHSCPSWHFDGALGHISGYPAGGGSATIHKVCTRSGCGVTLEDGNYHSFSNGTLQWTRGTDQCTAYYIKSCDCGYSYTYYPTVYQRHYADATCTSDATCECYAYDGSDVLKPCPTTHYESAKLGHLKGAFNHCTATCTSAGYNYYDCGRSGCNATNVIAEYCAALGHNYQWGGTADTHRYCSRTGCTWTEGSTYHSYEDNGEPEWTTGTSKCSCSQPKKCECGHTKTVALTVYQRKYRPATCTENEKWECYISSGSACPTTHEQANTALGHSSRLDSDTATCTSSGTKTYKCSRCGTTTGTLVSDAKGHDWDDPGAVVVNECTTTCQRCGATCRHNSAQDYGYEYYDDIRHDILRSCPDCGYSSTHFTLWPTNIYGTQYKHSVSWSKTATKHSGTCTACRHYWNETHNWNSSDYDNTANIGHTGVTCDTCGYTCTHSNYGVTGWSSTYSYNATYHWQDFECGDCGFTTNTVDWYSGNASTLKMYAEHKFNTSGRCTVCGYKK